MSKRSAAESALALLDLPVEILQLIAECLVEYWRQSCNEELSDEEIGEHSWSDPNWRKWGTPTGPYERDPRVVLHLLSSRAHAAFPPTNKARIVRAVDDIITMNASSVHFENVYREAYDASMANDGVKVIKYVKKRFPSCAAQNGLCATMLKNLLAWYDRVELLYRGEHGMEQGLPRLCGPVPRDCGHQCCEPPCECLHARFMNFSEVLLSL